MKWTQRKKYSDKKKVLANCGRVGVRKSMRKLDENLQSSGMK